MKNKKAFHNALLEILNNKNLEDITVTELCSKADINRSTFYKYYDIPADCFHEIADQVINAMIDRIKTEKIKTVREFFEIYFESASENKMLFRTIHRTNIFNSYIISLVDEFMKIKTISPDTNELTNRFVCYGFFGVTADWLENRYNYSSDDIIKMMTNLDEGLKQQKNENCRITNKTNQE